MGDEESGKPDTGKGGREVRLRMAPPASLPDLKRVLDTPLTLRDTGQGRGCLARDAE